MSRETKKSATRQRLIDVALQLFAAHGFDAVTVADVAAAAGVSEKTVFNYFPQKEDLVFSRRDASERALLETIRARRRGESILAAVKRHTLTLAAEMHAIPAERRRAYRKIMRQAPALRERMFMLTHVYEEQLAALIAEETGATDPAARVLATIFTGLSRLGYGARPWSASELSRLDETQAAIEAAFTLVGKGLGRYGVKGR
jgi:AcrR family transcriptional regulator